MRQYSSIRGVEVQRAARHASLLRLPAGAGFRRARVLLGVQELRSQLRSTCIWWQTSGTVSTIALLAGCTRPIAAEARKQSPSELIDAIGQFCAVIAGDGICLFKSISHIATKHNIVLWVLSLEGQMNPSSPSLVEFSESVFESDLVVI